MNVLQRFLSCFFIRKYKFKTTRFITDQNTAIISNSSDNKMSIADDESAEYNNKQEATIHPRFYTGADKLSTDELKEFLWKYVREKFKLNLDGLTLHIISKFIDYKWTWLTMCDDYDITDNGLRLTNTDMGDSCWSRWAYTLPFEEEGIQRMQVFIDKKRQDQGWLGIGVIRKKYVEEAETLEGGFKVYSNHAIFVDPSWNAMEPHFNLLSLDVTKQSQLGLGDKLIVEVNNNTKQILFFANDEKEHFAEGNWGFLNYEPLCGYAILTSYQDELTFVV